MAFNSDWDQIYTKKAMGSYPDTALVRFIAKNYYKEPDRKAIKFFDVGCGAGSSTWYLAREGFSVAAIDGSLIATDRLRQRLQKENLEALIACGDLADLTLKSDYFDCIIDISALCYVPNDKIDAIMSELHKVLKPGGKFFSITPSIECDKAIFNNIIEGVDLQARFLSDGDIKNLFRNFTEFSVAPYMYDDVKLLEIHAVK
jgi:2-polyprenyl-3-methyl-5-hydroxy-6-metoxy-1,4-benzoquinol methylase